MRLTELKGRPVVDPTTARRRGVIVDALIDPSSAKVAALEIATPDGDAHKRIAAEQVARVGRDAVMLVRHYTANAEYASSAADAEDASSAADGSLACPQLVGLEVLDEDGDRVGSLRDAQLDPDGLAIRAYDLAGPPWRRWLGQRCKIRVDEVTAWSSELRLVKSPRMGSPLAVNGESEPEPPSQTQLPSTPERAGRSRARVSGREGGTNAHANDSATS